jgi:hypothetical protein
VVRVNVPETAMLISRAMATVTAAARTVYPHDALREDVYARVGEKLAEVAREDSVVARTIEAAASRSTMRSTRGARSASRRIRLVTTSEAFA